MSYFLRFPCRNLLSASVHSEAASVSVAKAGVMCHVTELISGHCSHICTLACSLASSQTQLRHLLLLR